MKKALLTLVLAVIFYTPVFLVAHDVPTFARWSVWVLGYICGFAVCAANHKIFA